MAPLPSQAPRPWYLLALAVAGTLLVMARWTATLAPSSSGSSPSDSTTLSRALQELAAAEQRWNERGPENYQLRIRVTCFCPSRPVLRVTVRSGVAQSEVDPGDSTAGPAEDQASFSSRYTVPALFAEIHQLLQDTNWTVDATYDSALGYPRTLATSHRRITDIGRGIQVLTFETLRR